MRRDCAATVLIAGGDGSVRAVTQRMLQRCGYRTLDAANGAEAVALFHRHAEDVAGIVIDLGMPAAEVEGVFDRARAARPEVPVLLTGGFGEDAVAARLVGAARTGFLPKPFGLDALGAKAGDLFGLGRRSPAARGPAPLGDSGL